MGIVVRIAKGMPPEPGRGSGGLKSHMAGIAATVSAIALATGGIGPGGLIETDRK